MKLLKWVLNISVLPPPHAAGAPAVPPAWGGHTSILDLGLFSRQESANASVSTAAGVKVSDRGDREPAHNHRWEGLVHHGRSKGPHQRSKRFVPCVRLCGCLAIRAPPGSRLETINVSNRL